MGSDGPFDWAIAGRALPGQTRSGDGALVMDSVDRTLLVTVDGLGHGPEAADAAERALQTIADNGAEPVDYLFILCHQALEGSRGAAMAIAAVHADGAADWLSVGNVEAAVVRAADDRPRKIETVFHFAGVVGHQLPTLHVPQVQFRPGDLLVMSTDGIASAFLDDFRRAGSPQRTADAALARYAKPTDDALILVAAYQGP